MGGAVSAKSERRGASILTVVGKAQLSGEGLPNSRSDAARLFALAADEGDAHGICALADCHMNGWGVPYDPPGAFQMYKEAAALGYPPAMHCLGLCHRAGCGTEDGVNMEESFAQFRHAATAEYGAPVESMHELGVCYLRGLGTAKLAVRGVSWLTKSARQGYEPSGVVLRNYYQGIDLDKGSLSIIQSAAKNGEAWAMNNCGIIACRDAVATAAPTSDSGADQASPSDKSSSSSSSGSTAEDSSFFLPTVSADPSTMAPTEVQLEARRLAEKWFRQAIATGDSPESKHNLGIMCIRGWCDGGAFEGLRLIHEAATEGLPAGLAALGTCYLEGHGVASHLQIATRLFREAAKLGSTEAQQRIGESFFFGKGGMREDIVEAAVWLGKAATAGRAEAQARLGRMLVSGELPQPSRPAGGVAQGLRMLRSAASLGSRPACHSLSECYEFGLDSADGTNTRVLEVDLKKAQELMRRAADIGEAEKDGRLLTQQGDGFELSVATPTAPPTDPRELRRRAKARKRAQRRMTKGGVSNQEEVTGPVMNISNGEASARQAPAPRRNKSIESSGITTPRPGRTTDANARADNSRTAAGGGGPQAKYEHKKTKKKRGKARHLPIPPLPVPDSATPHLSIGWSENIHAVFHGPHGPGLQGFGMMHSHCGIGGTSQTVGVAKSSVHPWGGQTEMRGSSTG